MLKVGLSIGNTVFEQESLLDMRSSGIEAIEISYSDYQSYDGFDFSKAKKYTQNCGIEIWSLHLPFAPFEEIDPSSFDPDMRRFTFEIFSEIIKKGSSVGINKFVVHPSAEPNKESERSEKLKFAAEFFSELAETADKYGSVLAVEDLPRTCLGNCSSEISYILSANDKLRVCYDTNHILAEDNIEFIKKIGPKIITVHISDYDFLNERHWLPGEGDNDWLAIYKALQEVGYDGVWLYELGLKPPVSINRRELIYKDFYNNAMEIMSEKTPSPIGRRVEGLGSWK